MKTRDQAPATDPSLHGLDIPYNHLLSHLYKHPNPRNVVVTLTLHSHHDIPSSTNHLLNYMNPSFPLLAPPSNQAPLTLEAIVEASAPDVPADHLNHLFPITEEISENGMPPRSRGYVLDFGEAGMIMRREAMNMLSGATSMDLGVVGMDSSVVEICSLGWVDLLVSMVFFFFAKCEVYTME